MKQNGQLPELEHLLGTKVLVTNVRTKQEIGGELQFVGYNEHFPSWGLVCTIDRMPAIHINSVADIRIRPEPFTVKTTQP